MVGELSQEFLRSQRAAKLAEKMCQCYDQYDDFEGLRDVEPSKSSYSSSSIIIINFFLIVLLL